MTALTSLIGSRFGLAGVVAVLMGLVIGGLWLDRAGLKSDLSAEQAKTATLQAQIEAQNAAVEKMKADALAVQTAADARAIAALKPRPKPNTATIESLNQWLSGN